MNSRWKDEYQKKLLSIEDAANLVNSSDVVVASMMNGSPRGLLAALGKRAVASEIENVDAWIIGSIGPITDEWCKPEYADNIRLHDTFIMSPSVRNGIKHGYAEYMTAHGYAGEDRFEDTTLKGLPKERVKVMAAVSPMDHNGFFSFALTPGYIMGPCRQENSTVILEVNRNQPLVFGDNFIHISEVDYIVENDVPLITMPPAQASEADTTIAYYVSDMIEDESTIQLGIGGIPNMVGRFLENKHNLGVNSEMICDAFKYLWEIGVLTGTKKYVNKKKITGSFVLGSAETYEWCRENPLIEVYPQKYTNDPFVIAQHYKAISVNQFLEIDLTGQVSSESIGPMPYSGSGGQYHWVMGVQRTPGGKSFLCANSVAEIGGVKKSRIVPTLPLGTTVTTLRNDVHYVVTEYGVADLRGKTLRQRFAELISIAHPDFRAELRTQANKLWSLT